MLRFRPLLSTDLNGRYPQSLMYEILVNPHRAIAFIEGLVSAVIEPRQPQVKNVSAES